MATYTFHMRDFRPHDDQELAKQGWKTCSRKVVEAGSDEEAVLKLEAACSEDPQHAVNLRDGLYLYFGDTKYWWAVNVEDEKAWLPEL